MRMFVLSFIIIFGGLFQGLPVFGQKKSLPEWITGTWHNSYESNIDDFVFWTFSNDSIFIGKGLWGFKSNRECLNIKYAGYKMATSSNDRIYKISYSKNNERIVYEFELQKVDYSIKPVLTYSLTTNGATKRHKSTSVNLVLTKG